MPTVTGTEVAPDGTPHANIPVYVRLLASTTGEAAGYNAAGDYSIIGRTATTTNASGAWTLTLAANAALIPANTVYVADVVPPGRPAVRHIFAVPDGAGPYRLEDILAAPPVDLVTHSHPVVHPDLAAHDTLGLATQAELDTHAGAADPHAGYRLESAPIGVADLAFDPATQAELDATTTLARYEAIVIAVGDETTAITVGVAKVTFRMPYAMSLTAVRASLTTASTSGLPTVDINEGGTTILSTKLTIDANERTSTTAATPPVISDSSLADDAEITIDIDAAGTGAAGLKVYLIGTRA